MSQRITLAPSTRCTISYAVKAERFLPGPFEQANTALGGPTA